MKQQSLADWLEDYGADEPTFVWYGPDEIPVPTLWGTKQFYETAISVGLTNPETILQTLVVMEYADRMARDHPNVDWERLAPFVLESIRLGHVPDDIQYKWRWFLFVLVLNWRLDIFVHRLNRWLTHKGNFLHGLYRNIRTKHRFTRTGITNTTAENSTDD